MAKVYITLDGGMIRNVYTDVPNMEVRIIDFDNMETDGNIAEETLRNNEQMLDDYDNGRLVDAALPPWCG